MAYVQELAPLDWITKIVVGLIGFVITGILFRYEMLKRRSPDSQILSNYLRATSSICLWCGPISTSLLMLSVVPGFCMVRMIGTMMAFHTQFLFLGLYQLSRLHYCFSSQQTRTKKGYPFWVFVVLITVGIIIWIFSMMLHIFVDTLPSKCGYSSDYSFFCRFRERAILFDGDSWTDEWLNEIWLLWAVVMVMTTFGMDLVILLLYLYKLWQIGKIHKSKKDGVWNNILFILHRIVIITIFYQLCALFTGLLYNVWISIAFLTDTNDKLRPEVMIVFCIVVLSFSICLMMDHNTDIYVVFLHFLRRFRLKYCCFCCYYKMVDQQLEQLDPPKEHVAQTSAANPSGDNMGIESTMFPNLSVNIVHTSDALPRTLSCETVTQIVSPTCV